MTDASPLAVGFAAPRDLMAHPLAALASDSSPYELTEIG